MKEMINRKSHYVATNQQQSSIDSAKNNQQTNYCVKVYWGTWYL